MAHCTCPPGYTLLDDDITCEKITTATATPPVTGIPIAQNLEPGSNIGNRGLLVLENITSIELGGTKQWPIIDTPQTAAGLQSIPCYSPPNVDPKLFSLSTIPPVGPNWTSISPLPTLPEGQHQPAGTPLPGGYPPLGMPASPTVTCLRESIVNTNVLYPGTGNPVMPLIWQDAFPWKLGMWGNGIGIWPDVACTTNFKWVGLSKCITVTEARTFYVLMSCNNAFRFSVNGQLAVERNTGDGLTTALGYVNAFPITLPVGTHTLYFEGFNYSGGGGLAVDILDCTEAQLLAITNLTQILPYRIFSTLERRLRPINFTGTGTTLTSLGLFLPTDVGAFIDALGFPTTAYITQFIDANTVLISETLGAPVTTTGSLFFYWDTGNVLENTWTCPEGYLFGNCDGPVCILREIADCTPLPPVPCYTLTSCDGSVDPIKVNNDLSANVGQVINLCPEDFPAATPSPVQTGTGIRQSPNEQGISGGVLISCCPDVPNVYTLNDSLITYGGLTLFIPSLPQSPCWTYEKAGTEPSSTLINLAGAVVYNDCPTCNLVNPCTVVPTITECTCFTVSSAADCVGSITLLSVPAIAYVDCTPCAPVCYLLTNCEDPLDTILTFTNFEDYVGEVIKLLDTCPDKCWSVTIAPDCVGAISLQQTIESFATCEACLPPVPEVPVNLKTRAVKPGFYTPGCPPDYTLKVNCKFAEAVYRELLVLRYGITPCCDEDDHKWNVKKALLELSALYDPELCKCLIEICSPPTCLESSITVYRPTACAAPTDLTALLITF